nr:hypothetical protein [Flavimaribacter sediminis]
MKRSRFSEEQIIGILKEQMMDVSMLREILIMGAGERHAFERACERF